MIQIIPSISVIKGKCVRLKDGSFEHVTEYADNVLDVARQFEDHGIGQVHLIDLEGSLKGEVINYPSLELITGYTKLKVDFGGGINTDGDLGKVFESGADKATIGSLSVLNRSLLSSWVISYGWNKLTLSADTLNGKVQVRGWQKATETDLTEHIHYYHQRSVMYVKCADIQKDGKLAGPNISLYQEILRQFPDIRLIASGGVGSVDHLKQLQDIGVWGACFGKAFYEKKISLKELEQFIASQKA